MAHMEIVDNGNDSIIDFGVFVDTWDPTIESKKFPGNPVVISGLEHDTEYFVRGYAENSAGIGLGNAESFTTVAFPTRQIISSPPFTITINSSNKRVQIHNRSWFVYQFSDMQGNVILKRINIGRVANVRLESGTFRLDLSDRWLIPTFTQTHFFTIY